MTDEIAGLDTELLLYTLLSTPDPGVPIQPETDSDSPGALPLVQYDLSGSGATGNGPGLYQVTLDLNVFAYGRDEARRIALALYARVHSWEQPGQGIVPGLGWVQTVADISYPSSVGTPDMTAHNLVQYAGSWSIQLRGL